MGLSPELVSRWFLPRHPWTGGNELLFLTEGAAYFEQWFSGVDELVAEGGPGRKLFHTAWRLTDVARRGRLTRSERVLSHLVKASNNGVEMFVTVSGHGFASAAWRTMVRVARRPVRGLAVLLDFTAPGPAQSDHRKLTVFAGSTSLWALLGSVDLAPSRFERAHSRIDYTRYRSPRGRSHDIGLRLTGPIARDLHDLFVARWNALIERNARRRRFILGHPSPLELRREPGEPRGTGLSGDSAVQLVETIPNRSDVPFQATDSLWRLYAKALETASRYIYVEDQYFNPSLRDTDASRSRIPADRDLLARLIAAIRRQVHIVLVLPTPKKWVTSPSDRLILRRRHNALAELAAESQAAQYLHVFSYGLPSRSVYIHSKTLICDDEFALVGSANVNRRGMMSDNELAVGIVDPEFVTSIRGELWAEHFGLPAFPVPQWDAGIQRLSTIPSMRVTRYEFPPTVRPLGRLSQYFLDNYVDPI